MITKKKGVYAHTVKNITAFRFFVIISFALSWGTLSFPFPLQGQTEPDKPEAGEFPYTFSVSSIVGFLYGQGEEIVYQNVKSGVYLSELLWDIKPLVYSGLVLDISRKKSPRFFYSVSLKFGFPMASGTMEDRDWMAWNRALSHYSRHDSRIDEAWFHDFSWGISLPFGSRVLVQPFLDLSYTHLKWTASDGYLKYAKKDSKGDFLPLEDSTPEVPVYGRVIDYTQEWLVFRFGVSLSYVFHPRFSAGLSLRLSPLLYFTGIDEHYMRNIQFSDYILGGLDLEPGGEFIFNFNKWFSAGLYVSWRYMKGKSHGVSYKKEETEDGLYRSYVAGAAWRSLDSSLRVSIRF